MRAIRIDPQRHKKIDATHLCASPSKSHTLRALAFALMGSGVSYVHNYLPSPDTDAMLRAIELLGAQIEQRPNLLKIQGTGGHLYPPADVIHAGNSGQVLRFIGALSALSPHYTVFTGDHSIRSNRPISPLLDAITQMGATAVATRNNGFAPFIVKGNLQPGCAQFAGRDSQPVSAMLMACSFLQGPSQFTISTPGETPWIDVTLDWLKRLGTNVHHSNYTKYSLPGGLRYRDFSRTIPGDFSSASYPLAAAILHKRALHIEGLDRHDSQGDKALLSLLTAMGAKLEWTTQNVLSVPSQRASLQGVAIDVDPLIDALPLLAVLGCYAEGDTHLFNAASARHKESDRLACVTKELRKMGGSIEENASALTISPQILRGAQLESYHDHRIAMALTVAALGATSPSFIVNTACIEKSYPHFVSDMQKMGFCVEVTP